MDKYLVVGQSGTQAHAAWLWFDLCDIKDKDDAFEWRYMGVGEPLLGHRFSRIIVLPMRFASDVEKEATRDWLEMLKLKLCSGGRFIML